MTGLRHLTLSIILSCIAGQEILVFHKTLWLSSKAIVPGDPLPVYKDVHQGSIFAPTLFSIYIDNIIHVDNSHVHQYACDTVLHTSRSHFNFALSLMQTSFNNSQHAFSDFHLTPHLTTRKVKCIFFNRNLSQPERLSLWAVLRFSFSTTKYYTILQKYIAVCLTPHSQLSANYPG